MNKNLTLRSGEKRKEGDTGKDHGEGEDGSNL